MAAVYHELNPILVAKLESGVKTIPVIGGSLVGCPVIGGNDSPPVGVMEKLHEVVPRHAAPEGQQPTWFAKSV